MWFDIPGYEGRYSINENGEVLSHKYRKQTISKILQPRLSKEGYYSVKLYNDKGVYKRYPIHRLVALTFIPNPFNKREVNHIDEDKLNNHVNNLEWVTPKENCNHGTRIKRITRAINYKLVGEKNGKPIEQLDINNNVIRRWLSLEQCKLATGYDKSNLVKCCKNKMKTAYGYKWRYA